MDSSLYKLIVSLISCLIFKYGSFKPCHQFHLWFSFEKKTEEICLDLLYVILYGQHPYFLQKIYIGLVNIC